MSDLTPGKAVAITPLITRILAPNASLLTGPGTNSYLVGKETKVAIDPGPNTDDHIDAIIAAANGQPINKIFVTHTHPDHSPGAKKLKEKTGAEIIGMKAPEGYSQDKAFSPDITPKHEEIFDCGDCQIQSIYTPGHASNHFCFLVKEEGVLFTGDHIMEGSTVVIAPPDGNMKAYIEALADLKNYPIKAFAPGHGLLVETPFELVDHTIAHRMKREGKVIDALKKTGGDELEKLVPFAYDDTPEHLYSWAKFSLLAHLIKLKEEEKASEQDGVWKLH